MTGNIQQKAKLEVLWGGFGTSETIATPSKSQGFPHLTFWTRVGCLVHEGNGKFWDPWLIQSYWKHLSALSHAVLLASDH